MTAEILVKEVEPQLWRQMAEDAHVSVFNEHWDAGLERIDFALVMVHKDSDKIISYATATNIDSSTVYLSYGGAFPTFKGTPITFMSFQHMLDHLKRRYKRIVTLVENTNTAMLRFYMKEKFLITGIRYFGESIFLENTYDFND